MTKTKLDRIKADLAGLSRRIESDFADLKRRARKINSAAKAKGYAVVDRIERERDEYLENNIGRF